MDARIWSRSGWSNNAMTPEQIESELARARAAGVSESAIGVIRERLVGSPVSAAPAAPSAVPTATPASGPSYADRVAQHLASMQSDEESGVQAAKNAVGTFFGSAVDTGSLGYATKLVGGSEGQAALEAARQQHPVAGLAGDITGAVVSPITKGIGQFAAGTVGMLGRAGSAVAPAAAAALEATHSILARGSLAAVNNILAGALGSAIFEGAKSSPDETSRIDRMRGAALSPEGALLGAGIGAFTASLGRNPGLDAAQIRPMIERFERITGQRVPVAVYTDNRMMQRQMDSMARIPELADDVSRVRRRAFDGMRQLGAAIADDLGAGTDTPDVAAARVRQIAGKPTDSLPTRGEASARREAIQGRFFARHGAETLPDAGAQILGDVYRDTIAGRTPADRTGASSPLTALFEPIVAEHRNPIRLDHLEAIRKQLYEIGFSFDQSNPNHALWGERGSYEARRIYGAVVEAMNQITPEFQRVNTIAQYLHRVEDAVKDVPKSTMDDSVMTGLWRAPNLLTAWREIERGGNAADISTLRGDYFHRLLRQLQDADGLISPENVRKTISDKAGIFNRQIVDRIVPGALQEINDYARLSSAVRRTFPNEGSQTAGRLAEYANRALQATQLGSLIVGMFTNPFSGIASALGVNGIKQVLLRQARSMIDGHLEDTMQRLARGGRPGIVAMPQIASQAAGGVPAAVNAGTQAAGSIANIGGSAIGSGVDTMMTPVEERGK